MRDRVAQTLAGLILAPMLALEFEDSSFGYRRGRSVDQAVRRVIALRDAGFVSVVDADIDDYFDRIPHPPLRERLGEYVCDRRVLRLVETRIKNDVFWAGEVFTITRGVPRGSPISPLPANLYLDEFDQAFESGNRKWPCLLRPAARRKVTRVLEGTLSRQISHPDAETSGDFRRAVALQARRLRNAVRDGAVYEPFRMR